jgi:radical SAM protein with 4Fe4S-binding SPASM domain
MKKIEKFIKLRDKMKAPIEVNVPVLVYNNYLLENNTRKIQAEMLKVGVDRIRYSVPQTPVSDENFINTKNNKLVRSLQAAGGDSVYVKLISGERFNRCYVMANTVSIDHKGDVYPCSQVCSSRFKGLSYGSIKNNGLAEIWGGEKRKKLFYNFNQIPTRCRCNTTDYQFNLLCSLAEQEII